LTQCPGSAFGIACRLAGVSRVLGKIALIRTPLASTSVAATSARAVTAAFEAAYAEAFALVQGRSTARDPMTTMLPCLRATIPGRSARSDWWAVSRLALIMPVQV